MEKVARLLLFFNSHIKEVMSPLEEVMSPLGHSMPNHRRIVRTPTPPQILAKLGVFGVSMVLITHADF